MATAKRITRKEIKQPDEFLTLSARTIEFAQAHSREISMGAAAILLLGLLVWAASAYQDRREARAARLLAQSQALLRTAASEAETQDSAAKGANASTPAEVREKSMALLREVVEDYKRTEASGAARILLAQLLYDDGKYDAAIEAYDEAAKRSGRNPELVAMAWEGLAYSHEAKEDFQRALEYYEKLSKSSAAHFQGWGYLGMARCYERVGNPGKAIDAYQALLTEHPQHPMAAEVQASVARISQSLDAAKTPEAPAPEAQDGSRGLRPSETAPGEGSED
jgi:tetratricopeptide (TPR) repeat protein